MQRFSAILGACFGQVLCDRIHVGAGRSFPLPCKSHPSPDVFNHGVSVFPFWDLVLLLAIIYQGFSCTHVHGVFVWTTVLLRQDGKATRYIKPVGRQMRDHWHLPAYQVPGPWPWPWPCFFVRGCHFQQTEGLLSGLPLLLLVSGLFRFSSVLAFWQFCAFSVALRSEFRRPARCTFSFVAQRACMPGIAALVHRPYTCRTH